MIEFWRALGRLCSDRPFFDQVCEGLEPPSGLPVTMPEAKVFIDALREGHGFVLSRWEVLELHRVTRTLAFDEKCRKALAVLHVEGAGGRSDGFYRTMGLCCVDGVMRDKLERSSDLRADLAKGPALFVTANEAALIKRCFVAEVPEASARPVMETIERIIWEVPFACSPAYEYSEVYRHADKDQVHRAATALEELLPAARGEDRCADLVAAIDLLLKRM